MSNEMAQALVGAMVLGSLYAVVGIGFVILYKATHVLNFAQGSLMLIGGFIFFTLSQNVGLPWPIAMVLTLVAMSSLGGVIYLGVLPAPRRRRGVHPRHRHARPERAAPDHLPHHLGTGHPDHAGQPLPVAAVLDRQPQLLQRRRLRDHVVGRRRRSPRCRAAAHPDRHPDACRRRPAAPGLAHEGQRPQDVGHRLGDRELLRRVAGIAYAMRLSVDPVGMHALGLLAFPAILLGGLDSVRGVLAGGFVLALCQSSAAYFIGGEWSEVTAYAVMLLVLFVRPRGFFGSRQAVRL